MTAARPRPIVAATAAATVLVTLAALTAAAPLAVASPPGNTVRFATYNASLNRNVAGQLIQDLATPNNAQAAAVAEIIQRERPDVLLINEFDFDAGGVALARFQDNYLSVPHNGAAAIDYPYAYTAPSNTGIASGFDLNNFGGVVTTPGATATATTPSASAHSRGSSGWRSTRCTPSTRQRSGRSRTSSGRTCRARCNRMPQPAWYSAEEQAVLPVSSKSHWDLPIQIGKRTVHFLTSHPTPPVFDGAEDRNGRRNFDEIRLWADYITPGAGGYIYDDAGVHGGLAAGESFVIAGDQNSDPLDGDSIPGAIQQLIENPGVNT